MFLFLFFPMLTTNKLQLYILYWLVIPLVSSFFVFRGSIFGAFPIDSPDNKSLPSLLPSSFVFHLTFHLSTIDYSLHYNYSLSSSLCISTSHHLYILLFSPLPLSSSFSNVLFNSSLSHSCHIFFNPSLLVFNITFYLSHLSLSDYLFIMLLFIIVVTIIILYPSFLFELLFYPSLVLLFF